MTSQEVKDKAETAELLGTAYGALHRFANDYFDGDFISMWDVNKARAALRAIDAATEKRERRAATPEPLYTRDLPIPQSLFDALPNYLSEDAKRRVIQPVLKWAAAHPELVSKVFEKESL